ncbi:MAG TPA: hypothetical protein VNT99_21505 [Methylomirabilota bacterium]|nr:hypothetical protein [Methylomirabilota bacterium]
MSARPNQPLLLPFLAIVICVIAFAGVQRTSSNGPLRPPKSHEPISLSALLTVPDSNLCRLDIAWLNVLCAEGLPGSGSSVLSDQLKTLEAWSQRIASETERYWYRYRQDPKEFDKAEGFFRILLLALRLKQLRAIAPLLAPARSTVSHDHEYGK